MSTYIPGRTDFFVSPLGDSRNSGSTNIQALIVASNVNVETPNVVVDTFGGGWIGASVGDWLCWDTGGVKERARIVALDGDNATVNKNLTTDGGNKTSRVGGPFPTIQAALSDIDATFVNANGDPPFINVSLGTYTEAPVAARSGTAAVPITIEAYYAHPGDLRGTMTCALVQKNSGISGSGVFNVTGSFINVRNISVSTTQVGTHGFFVNNVTNVHLINCVSSAPGVAFYLVVGGGHLIDTCLVTAGGNSGYPAVYVNSSNGAAIVNLRVAGLNASAVGAVKISYAQGTWISGCVFYGFTGDCIVLDNGNTGVVLTNNTANTIAGHFVNAGTLTDISSLTIAGSIFAGVTGKVIYSNSATSVNLARFAHCMVYNCGSPYFSTKVITAVEDVNTTDNPFSGGETLSAAVKSHAILLADGSTQTYPDYGAVQAQAFAAGGLLVNSGMTGGMTG
jgi:hypothetical protein